MAVPITYDKNPEKQKHHTPQIGQRTANLHLDSKVTQQKRIQLLEDLGLDASSLKLRQPFIAFNFFTKNLFMILRCNESHFLNITYLKNLQKTVAFECFFFYILIV